MPKRRFLLPLAAGVALGAIWLLPGLLPLERLAYTVVGCAAAGLLLLAAAVRHWRLRWHKPIALAAGTLGAAGLAGGALFAVLVRLEGFDGDLTPILAWRWTPTAEQAVAEFHAARPGPALAPDLAVVGAHDYPEFLGRGRNATRTGVRLSRDWSANPPELVWRNPIGPGMSSFAVVGGYAVTQEQREDQEMVVCYEIATGRQCWTHADLARFSESLGGDGPRATPTIHEGRVYSLGATGILNCLEGATGDVVWSVNILDDNDAENIAWGMSGSPLVVDDLVIVAPGGTDGASLAAYDCRTGQRRWAGGSDPAAYSSPMLATLGGVRQILIFNGAGLASHDPTDGRVLWSFPWETNYGINVCQPVVLEGDRVFISSGYGVGCALLQVRRAQARGGRDRWSVEPLWRNRELKAKFANVVAYEGCVYGLDDGILVCLDLDDGTRRWKDGRYGHGQVLLVGDLLLVQAEDGAVALVEATPVEFRELAYFRALDDRTWNHPVLAGRYLLVRNSREAACYRVALRDEEPAARKPTRRARKKAHGLQPVGLRRSLLASLSCGRHSRLPHRDRLLRSRLHRTSRTPGYTK